MGTTGRALAVLLEIKNLNMTEVELKILIEHGQSVQLVAMPRVHDLKGYTVAVDTGQVARREIMTRRGNVRVFKHLDTLFKFCQQLGVPEFSVKVR